MAKEIMGETTLIRNPKSIGAYLISRNEITGTKNGTGVVGAEGAPVAKAETKEVDRWKMSSGK